MTACAFPRVSVIIPTKSRPESIERVTRSLLAQTVLPAQLIVVDQNSDHASRERVEALYSHSPTSARVCLSYLHDPGVPGAAVARNRGMDVANGEILLFLDDDMEPEPDFIEQLLMVYVSRPSVMGVSGIVTNYPTPPLAFRVWVWLFLRGRFHDERQPIYWSAERLRHAGPIAVSQFGSGLMSFRTEAVREVRFDESLRGLPPGEDLDFCARLGPSARLVIAPAARIAHRASELGRSHEYWMKDYAQGKLYVYHRNWRHGLGNRVSCLWFECGCLLAASLASLRRGSLRPLRAFIAGVREAAAVAASSVGG